MEELITNGKHVMIRSDRPQVFGDVVGDPDGEGRRFRIGLPAFPTTDATNLYNVVQVEP